MLASAKSLLTSDSLAGVKEILLANAKTLALATGAGAALVYTARAWHRASQLPPGPLGVPILGRIPWLDMSHIDESQEEMRKVYGDIYSYRFGNRLMIVVSSRQLLKEMLSQDVFSGRQVPESASKTANGCGILFTEGAAWSEQRRVSLRVLRDFGFARAESVDLVNEEISILMDKIETSPNSVKTLELFNAQTNSVIAVLVFGRRYADEDERYVTFLGNAKYLFDQGLIGSLPFLFPYLSAPLSLLVPSVEKIKQSVSSIKVFIESEIVQRKAILEADLDAEGTCLCDAYIKEKQRAEATGDSKTFSTNQLIQVGLELFLAGTDTTAKTLEWLMVYMAAFPDAQAKVREEIHQLVGAERRPTVSDKAELHYTLAVIDEAMRLSSLVANALSHRALSDTRFRGYLIPSDAAIVPFIYGLHRDPKVWSRPFDFYPEHFLDAQGHYAPSNSLLPFSTGKRACPGESLAKLEIYLTFTAIVQCYRVRFSRGCAERVDAILRGTCGLVRDAGDHRIDFVRV